jgi:hypothetical protein
MTTQHFIQRGQTSMTTLCARIATTKIKGQVSKKQGRPQSSSNVNYDTP